MLFKWYNEGYGRSCPAVNLLTTVLYGVLLTDSHEWATNVRPPYVDIPKTDVTMTTVWYVGAHRKLRVN